MDATLDVEHSELLLFEPLEIARFIEIIRFEQWFRLRHDCTDLMIRCTKDPQFMLVVNGPGLSVVRSNHFGEMNALWQFELVEFSLITKHSFRMAN